MAKKPVKGTRLTSAPATKQAPSDLRRIVAYTAEHNEEGVQDFLDNANAPNAQTYEEMVDYAIMAIGIGKEQALTDFLALHPDKEIFTPDATTQERVVAQRRKPKVVSIALSPNTLWWGLLAFLCLVVLGVVAYLFFKRE